MNRLGLMLVLLAGLLATSTQAATCSCAGVPLLSSMDTAASEPGDLSLSYTVDFHEISDLVAGTREVNDETGRQRSSLSQVLSGSYGLSRRWAVSALVSYVEHERQIGLSALGRQRSSGRGDSVVLFRFNPLQSSPFSRNALAVGAGVRFKTGNNDAGGVIAFSEDMQPGTGAQGRIAWFSFSHNFNQAGTLALATSANFTANDENARAYSFGDEWNASAGLNYLNTRHKFGLGAALRYRHTRADERDGFTIPNTGGQWLDLIPTVQYTVNEKLGFTLSGRLPLARDLNGVLQFSTSYSYALSFSYAH